MKWNSKHLVLILFIASAFSSSNTSSTYKYISPSSLEIDEDKNILYIVGQTANCVLAYDLNTHEQIATYETALPPKDLALFHDKLLVVCSSSKGELLIFSTKDQEIENRIEVGHGASAIAIDKVREEAFVANQFSNDVSFISLKTNLETATIPVLRQPSALEVSASGQFLFVANFLTAGRADADTVAAEISVIDIQRQRLVKNITLANGSNALQGMCLSKDGKYLFISHNLGRFQVPTSQLRQGWMNTSGMSIIDAEKLEYITTVLLDEPERGAAGSWEIDCSEKQIFVAHSGTHDVSIIEYEEFINKLFAYPDKSILPYDLQFLSGIRRRIPVQGNGVRSIIHRDSELYAASYFSDTVSIINLNDPEENTQRIIALNPEMEIDSVRLGEIYFNDATYCFQQWQSCNGCHPGEARTDGLNWDLLNDGIGNPKNCKSMLFAHATNPSMISGIRPDAETAVRAGFKFIQFMEIGETHARAVDKYLDALRPVPSPFLRKGKLSPLAKKGKRVFNDMKCNQCHSGKYYTDFKSHEIGKQGKFDRQNSWDTPTLCEVWRTGPYLHDGRCATMKEVFTSEQHGIWKQLSEKEMAQLLEYVLSL